MLGQADNSPLRKFNLVALKVGVWGCLFAGLALLVLDKIDVANNLLAMTLLFLITNELYA